MDLVESISRVQINSSPDVIELSKILTGVELAGFVFAIVAWCNGNMNRAIDTYRLYDQTGLVYDLSLLYDQIADDLSYSTGRFCVIVRDRVVHVNDVRFLDGVRLFYDVSGLPRDMEISCN